MKNLILAASLILSLPAHAKRKIFLELGGGQSENTGATTYALPAFLRSAVKTASVMKKHGYEINAVFGGDQINNLIPNEIANEPGIGKGTYGEKLKAAYGKVPPPFTSGNLNHAIQNLIDEAKHGKLQRGDRVVIQVDAHGAIRTDDEKTHSVELASPDNDMASLDRLIELRDVLEKHGVHLAVIDTSCHSGYLLPLATKNTCVVSHASNTVGLGDFVDLWQQYDRLPQSKRNLEEAFLEARKNEGPGVDGRGVGFSQTFPRISSNEDQEIDPLIANIFTPGAEQLDDNSRLSVLEQPCQTHDEILKLMSAKKSILQGATPSELSAGFQQLNDLNQKLATLYDSTEWKQTMLEKNQYDVPWGDILGHCDPNIPHDPANDEIPENRDLCKKSEVLARLKNYLPLRSRERSLNKELNDIHRKLIAFERKFYDSAYRRLSKAERKPNPCRDFKL